MSLVVPRSARSNSFEPETLIRVLAYDRNLKARAGALVNLVVVYRSDQGEAGCVQPIRERLKGVNVSGLPVRVVAAPFTRTKDFEDVLASSKAAALYACEGLAQDAAGSISAVSRRLDILSFGSEASVRAGLSVGVVVRDQKKRLFINLDAARAEGARLAPELLRIAIELGSEGSAGQAAQPGELEINSPNVAGEVFVNGKKMGFAPIVVKQVAAGGAVIEVRVGGTVRRSKVVRVEPGKRTIIRFE